jgi:hypothetical protein
MREFEDYNEMIVNKINEKKLKKYFELDSKGDLDVEINGLLNELKEKITSKLPEKKVFKLKVRKIKTKLKFFHYHLT